jgi:glycogen synthase
MFIFAMKVSFNGILENALAQQNTKYPVKTLLPAIAPMQPDSFERKNESSKGKSFKDTALKYSGAAGLAVAIIGLPVTYILAKKSGQKLAKELSKTVETAVETAVNKLPQNKVVEQFSKKHLLKTFLLGGGSAAGVLAALTPQQRKELKKAGWTEQEIDEAVDEVHTALNSQFEAKVVAHGAKEAANQAIDRAAGAQSEVGHLHGAVRQINTTHSGGNPMTKLNTQSFYNINLLTARNWGTQINKARTDDVMNDIKNASPKRIERSSYETVKDIKKYKETYGNKLKSVWSVTAEFDPIQSGGLGVVPVDLQDNLTKLGVNSPVFIPMYLDNNGKFLENTTDNTFTYTYKNKKFELKKMAELKTTVYQDDDAHPEKLEYFLYEDKDKGGKTTGKQIVFIKNDKYFNDMYNPDLLTEEPERFTMFSKAVYLMAKMKVNQALLNEKNKPGDIGNIGVSAIINKEAFNKLEAPGAMIINDWHAGSLAGLLRYRAPMEYNYNELEKEPYEALKDMPLVMIGHNLGLQGRTCDIEGDENNKKKVTENVINTLYDKFAYGITTNAHSGISLHNNSDLCSTVLLKREHGDRHYNALFNGASLSDWFVPVSKNYSKEITLHPNKSKILLELLQRRSKTRTTEGVVNGLDKHKIDMNAIANNNRVPGLELKVYDQNTDSDKVIALRNENKAAFYDKFLVPLFEGKSTMGSRTPEIINDKWEMSKEEFMEAPLISFAHRLTGQKGLGLFEGAVYMLFDNWEKEFPGKPKPVILAGGDGDEKNYLEMLSNSGDDEKKKRIIALKGFMPNPAIMAASTFFVAPSTYEPCGLTQGESFAKGTPVIATKTGGFVDTIEDGKTGFLVDGDDFDNDFETENWDDEKRNKIKERLRDTLVKALRMYFDEPEKYKAMVMEDLNVDFSWIRKDPERKPDDNPDDNPDGPIYEYTDKLGYDRRELNK